MNLRIPAVAVACSIALIVSTVTAQQAAKAPRREGFWIGVGLGWGSATFNWGGDKERFGAVSGNLRLGGTLSRNLLAGVETNGWQRSISGGHHSLGALAGNLYVYPIATGIIYLKGGPCLVIKDSQSAFGLNAGVGLDLYTGRRFSLSPYVNYAAALNSVDRYVGRPTLLQIGMAAVWH